jgi:predicted metalloprotease with PDZ domain
MYTKAFMTAALLAAAVGGTAVAQSSQGRTSSTDVWRSADERAVLGISTSSSGDRDTLGLLITSITPGGPADKAGLEEGNRIAAINGVNLRLSGADAGESDMRGLTTRRLQRELNKLKAGDDAELRVWAGGQYKTMRVKTTAAEDLNARPVRLTREELDRRATIGVSFGGSGSRRDTLGLLVTAVAPDGPAEKAGIIEGDRIAAINGVDVRISREDVMDGYVTSASANRFTRELRKLTAGGDAELRVWSGGQYKTVRVKTAQASDVYKNQRGTFIFGDGGSRVITIPPVGPMIEGTMDGLREGLREGLRGLDEGLREGLRGLDGLRFELRDSDAERRLYETRTRANTERVRISAERAREDALRAGARARARAQDEARALRATTYTRAYQL